MISAASGSQTTSTRIRLLTLPREHGAWGILLVTPYLLVFCAFVVYPVLYGFYLARHYLGVGLIFKTPQGHARLNMPRKTRDGSPDQFPFVPAWAVNLRVAPIKMVIREIIGCDLVVAGHKKAGYPPVAILSSTRGTNTLASSRARFSTCP